MITSRDKHFLESYVKILFEAGKLATGVGTARTSALKQKWEDETKKIEDYLNLRKDFQEERKRTGKTPGRVSSGPFANFPKLKFENVIAPWISVANEWNRIDPDGVEVVYNRLIAIHKNTYDDSGVLQKDDPFAEIFGVSKSQTISSTTGGNTVRIIPNTWVPWASASNKVSYEPSAADAKARIGPGERRLCAELATIGAKGPMGSNVSFDMEIGGNKYEIKSISSNDLNVRAAAEGMRLFSPIRREFENIIVQMELFITKYEQVYGKSALVKQVQRFIDEEATEISAGSISEERLLKFSSVIQSISNEISKKGVNINNKRQVTLDQTPYNVTDETYNTILDMLGANFTQMSSGEKDSFLASILKSEAYKDVDKYFDDVETKLQPSAMFQGVTGVFLVTNNGYFYMDTSKVNNYFDFKSVKQGRPQYAFTGPKPPLSCQ